MLNSIGKRTDILSKGEEGDMSDNKSDQEKIAEEKREKLAHLCFLKAVDLHQQKNYLEALASYQQSLQLNPLHLDAIFALCEILNIFEQHDCIHEIMLLASQNFPDNPEISHILGDTLFKQLKYDEAMSWYEKAIEQKKEDAPHNLIQKILQISLMLSKNNRCITYAEKYVKDYPESPRVLAVCANALAEAEDIAQAHETFKKAIALEPENGRIQHDYAKFVLQKGDFDEAIQLYIQLINETPNNQTLLEDVSKVYIERNLLEKALPYQEKLQKLAPENINNAGLLLFSYYLLKEETKATALLEALKTSLSPFFYHMLALTQASYLSPIQKQASTTIEHIQSIPDGSIQPVHISHPAFSVLYKQVYQPTQPKTLMKKFNTIFSTPSISLSPPIKALPKTKPKVGLCLFNHQTLKNSRTLRQLTRLMDLGHISLELLLDTPSQLIINNLHKIKHVKQLTLDGHLVTDCKKIERQNYNILLTPCTHDSLITFFLAHYRLAEFQMTTCENLITSGAPEIDYFISSSLFESMDNQAHYSEKLQLFPDLPFILQPPINTQAKSGILDTNYHYYLFPHPVQALHHELEPIFHEILEKDPKGILILIKQEALFSLETEIKKRFKEDRVRLVHPRHLNQLLPLVHAVIDSSTCQNLNISLRSIHLGAPIITLPGEWMKTRLTYGLYKKIGIDSLVAEKYEDIVDLSLRLAHDTSFRKNLSKELLEKRPLLYEEGSIDEDWLQFFNDLLP
jgi:tetratricopeptide (TPR) repeat protein